MTRLMYGIPARRFDRMDTSDALDQYLYSAYPGWVMGPPDSGASLWKKTLVSPRVDMDRSKLIGLARAYGYDGLRMVDTDVRIHTPFPVVETILARAQEEFDVLVIPTVQSLGPGTYRVMVWPEPEEAEIEPYSIDEGAGGFIALSWRYLKEMEPVAYAKYMDEASPLPLYCLYPPETSEDISLCREARKQGFRIGAIPNITVSHEKAVYYTNQLPETSELKPTGGSEN